KATMSLLSMQLNSITIMDIISYMRREVFSKPNVGGKHK
ncbi:ABC transporter, ATP-binding/permease protein, partial [Listeria innocua FSL S4-378]